MTEQRAPAAGLTRIVAFIAALGAVFSAAGGAPLQTPTVRSMRFAARDAASARRWQQAARARLFALMMGGARPATVPLDARVVKRVENRAGGYTVEELSLQSLPDRRVHAWLTMPTGRKGRVAAVLALHGHGGTGEEVVHGQSLYWYGRALAQMGYAVISPDIGQHDLQHPNWSLMGERVWDALRCVDYLASRPEVDPRRMAVCGLSLGGETTMYTAALDERLRAVDSAGWLTTVANMKQGHCPCWDFPGLEETFDFADIFACVAPRPIVFEVGEKERAPGGFPVPVARAAFDEVKAAWRAFGAEDRAVLDVHPYGHVFVGREFWGPLRATVGAGYPWKEGAPGAPAETERRGEIARRAFCGALGVLDGWWAKRDPQLQLFPRRLDEPVWAPQDNAADMLPFLFLTAHYLAPERTPELMQCLKNEQTFTNRVGCMPDWYSIAERRFVYPEVKMSRILFNAAEYCKDGLNPMTEAMGPGPWTDRMTDLVAAVFTHAETPSDYGMLPADDTEVNGEILQVVARLFAMTKDARYWEWGKRVADAYFLEVLPATGGIPGYRWDFQRHRATSDIFSLNDHGNEIVGGLTEFYVIGSALRPAEAARYREPLLRMHRQLLAKARNADGIWHNLMQPSTGKVLNASPPDTWGYALAAAAAAAMVTDDDALREAVRTALRSIGKPAYLDWAGGADSFADSIEGCLLLLNRFPEPTGFRWLETVLPVFLAKQQDTGIVEGWYGDGNFARTALMAGLYYTQGAWCRPWRSDISLGAVREGDGVRLTLTSPSAWQGRVLFDAPRHRDVYHLPLNYPRLNEFPEWFTVDRGTSYRVTVAGKTSLLAGAQLLEGLPCSLARAGRLAITVEPVTPAAGG